MDHIEILIKLLIAHLLGDFFFQPKSWSDKRRKYRFRSIHLYVHAAIHGLLIYVLVGDFIVDDQYTFEVGGKNKKQKQIAGIEKSYIAADNIEYNYQNRIPLWLFSETFRRGLFVDHCTSW